MELALLLAPIGASLAAFIISWICMRLTGVYFAMLTLAVAQLLWSLAFQWGEVTSSDDGMVDIWPADWLSRNTDYNFFTLNLGVSGILFLRYAAHSPFGYALRVARESVRQAEVTSIHTK